MKILVGIDGSADALAALRFVSRLLDAQKDSVILYYSVPTSALESLRPQSTPEYATARDAFADAVFQQAKNALAPALGDTCVTIHDNEKPYKGLLKTADTHAAEMVVLGARGAGPLKRLLLGSVSHAVVHACELPTLVVRNAPS